MARQTQRQSNFPQLGGPGEYYHMTTKTGEPKLNERGNPEMAWKFPGGSPTFTDPMEHAAAMQNLVHSIRSASPEDVKHGMEWYPKVNEAVSKGIRKRGFMSGAEDKMMSGAALVAAVSPNMDWDRANIGAFSELASLKSEHWDAINAGDASPVRGMEVSSAPLKNLQKAGRLIRGESPFDVMPMTSAPKTHSFMHNIADPSNPHFVTVDGRAFDTLTNRMRPWEYTGRGIAGTTTRKSVNPRYEAAGGIFKEVAGDMDIDPSASQAISWSNIKYGVEQLNRTRKQGPARVGQPYFHPETGEPAAHLPVHLSGQFG